MGIEEYIKRILIAKSSMSKFFSEFENSQDPTPGCQQLIENLENYAGVKKNDNY